MSLHQEFLESLGRDDPGHFIIQEENGRAVLIVYPSGEKGAPVKLASVLARLDLLGLSGWDADEVAEIVEQARGLGEAICPWTRPDPIDASAEVLIAPDGMAADLEIQPALFGGKDLEYAFALDILTQAGVRYGLNEGALKQLLEKQYETVPEKALPVRLKSSWRGNVAQGLVPVPGEPAIIRHHYESAPRIHPESDGNNRVDFRKIHVIQTCDKDALLAEYIQARPGRSGFRVTGEELAPENPLSRELIAGPGARLENGALYSTLAGQVRFEEKAFTTTISVEEILRLPSVDFSTGHIDFPGTVLVEGAVMDGFKINARGDLIIQKSVGQVILLAGGDAVLAGGAAGHANIQATGDVFAKFVQNSIVTSKASIYIEEMAMNSRLTAGQTIQIQGGRGELIGGDALAAKFLRARKLGSKAETRTAITVGVSPEIMEELLVMEQELLSNQETLRKVSAHLQQIEESRRKKQDEFLEAETFEKLKKLELHYQQIAENLNQQRQRIYATLEPLPEAHVVATDAIFPGVEISFGQRFRRFLQERKPSFLYSRFIPAEGRVLVLHD